MQGIRLNYHGDQTIPLGTECDIKQLQHIYDLLFHILAYHAHLHHIKIKKKKIIPAYHFCTPIFTCKKKKIKVKCLQYPPQKTKGWKIMLTVKSQQKMSETSLATSKSNQSYKMHNYILSIVAQYIIFIIIFHLLTLVQYLISMFHLNCLSAFSLLVQSIISRHQC